MNEFFPALRLNSRGFKTFQTKFYSSNKRIFSIILGDPISWCDVLHTNYCGFYAFTVLFIKPISTMIALMPAITIFLGPLPVSKRSNARPYKILWSRYVITVTKARKMELIF